MKEDRLLPCPACDGKVTDDSFDRGIRFKCVPCGWTKSYDGLLQRKVSPVPIPYVDKDGNPVDTKDVKYQEYYHVDANDKAIKEFNDWAKSLISSRIRKEKIDTVLKKYYVLNAIISGDIITSIGVFDDLELLEESKSRWENSGMDISLYSNEFNLNSDNLYENPEKYFKESDMENFPKSIKREKKIDDIL